VTVRHVVLLRFHPDATDQQLTHLRSGLDELPGIVGTTRAYHHGPDLSLADGNHQYAIVADFADLAGYEAYRDHAWHQQLIAERLRPILANRTAVQYEFED
jgi:hypothetical protein